MNLAIKLYFLIKYKKNFNFIISIFLLLLFLFLLNKHMKNIQLKKCFFKYIYKYI